MLCIIIRAYGKIFLFCFPAFLQWPTAVFACNNVDRTSNISDYSSIGGGGNCKDGSIDKKDDVIDDFDVSDDDINATDNKCNGNSSTRDNIDVTYDFDCNGNWWYTNDVAVVLIICFSSGVIICFS